MNTDKEIMVAETTEDSAAENDLIVKLSKPYVFEGKTHETLDLSALESTTAGVLQSVGKIVTKKNPGLNPALLEMSLQFCTTLAARVMAVPLEFFDNLPARDAIAVKSAVTNFLYGGDGGD